MKLISFTCPNCGAPLKADGSRKINFCEYCGHKIFLDDEVRRTEHTENINITHRQIDEARLREADLRMKQAEIQASRELYRQKRLTARSKRRIIIAMILLGLFGVFTVRNRIMKAMDSRYELSLGRQVQEACGDSASIDSIWVSGERIYIDIISETSKTSEVDALQQAILDAITIKPGYGVEISFEKPKYTTIRDVSVNEYGSVTVDRDYTNELSDEEYTALVEAYTEGAEAVLREKDAELSHLNYQGNKIRVTFRCTTCHRETIDAIVDSLISLNQELDSKAMEITVEDSSGFVLRTENVKADGKVSIVNDYSNEMTDEACDILIEKYRESLTEACSHYDAEVSEMKVRNDILEISVSAEYEDKKRVGRLEKAIQETIGDPEGQAMEIRITGTNRFDTTKKWEIDEKGLVHSVLDFTKDE